MKVLLIDDDAFFQKFYSFKLREQGYEVVSALNGEEGLTMMQQEFPDIVLLDIIMPQKNGFDVLTEKKGISAISGIPVIVFSTLGQEEDIKKAISLGAHDYINKSFFDFEKLAIKIKAVSGQE